MFGTYTIIIQNNNNNFKCIYYELYMSNDNSIKL